METLAQAAAQGGTIILYGALAHSATPFRLLAALRKGLALRGYTLFEVVGNPERMAKGKQYVPDGLASGKLKPIIAKTFPFEKIVDAQEQRANRKDADATRPEGERHRCADTVTFKTTNAALPLVDRARTTIETAINALRMKTKGTAVDGSVKGNMQYAEIRSSSPA